MTWIVPHGIGGGYDTYSRLIEPFLEKTLDASITVKNVTGAGGIIGARQLAGAKGDGRTLGILGATGLMTARLADARSAPDPASDFTILGRVASTKQIWAAGADGIAATMDELFHVAEARPIIFATRDVASTSFVNVAVTTALLGIPYEMVAGYDGSRSAVMAAIRGEVHLVAQNFESILPQIVSRDLVPLLQVTERPIGSATELEGIPILGGPQGVAARRAEQLGRSSEEAAAAAAGLAAFLGAGRVVAAPKALGEEARECLELALQKVFADPAFRASAAQARRSLSLASAGQTRADLATASRQLPRFREIIEAAAARLRE